MFRLKLRVAVLTCLEFKMMCMFGEAFIKNDLDLI